MFNILKRFRKSSSKEEVKKVTLEASIEGCITNELNKGIIEKVITEKLEECISSSLKDMFSWNGAVKETVEEKVKSVMIPYLEKYDYSQYIVKLDAVMTEVLKETTKDNKEILGNFKRLMSADDGDNKTIEIGDLFSKWINDVEENIDTNDLEVNYDDDVSYESVECTYSFEKLEQIKSSNYERGRIIFECEHDEKMNVSIDVYRWNDINKKDEWYLDNKGIENLSSLRGLNKFQVFILGLEHSRKTIKIDSEYDSEEVTPSKEPEPYFA